MLFAVSRRVTETFNERQASDFALGAGVAIDVAFLAALGFDFHEKTSDSLYPGSRCTRFRDAPPSQDTARTGQVVFQSFKESH
jgi:hypothetical protein